MLASRHGHGDNGGGDAVVNNNGYNVSNAPTISGSGPSACQHYSMGSHKSLCPWGSFPHFIDEESLEGLKKLSPPYTWTRFFLTSEPGLIPHSYHILSRSRKTCPKYFRDMVPVSLLPSSLLFRSFSWHQLSEAGASPVKSSFLPPFPADSSQSSGFPPLGFLLWVLTILRFSPIKALCN